MDAFKIKVLGHYFEQTPAFSLGPAMAVQFVAAYTDATTGTRYVVPGAAFFQMSGGTIRRLRLYVGDSERAEVEAQPKKKP